MKQVKDDFKTIENMKSIVDDENYNIDESEEDDDSPKMINAIEFVTRDAIQFVGEDPTTKSYLLILTVLNYSDDKDEDLEDVDIIRDWNVITGRQETYDWLKRMIESGAIDIHRSFVLANGVNLDDAITVYRFMKTCYEGGKVRDKSSFDIDDGNDPVLPTDDLKLTSLD